MVKFILRRVLTGASVVLIVSTLTFFLLRVLPGGPFDVEKKLPPQIRKNIEEKYRLDQPLWNQYAKYLGDLARGDFGPSYKYIDRTVGDIIQETLPVSLKLGIVALLVSIAIGTVIKSWW